MSLVLKIVALLMLFCGVMAFAVGQFFFDPGELPVVFWILIPAQILIAAALWIFAIKMKRA